MDTTTVTTFLTDLATEKVKIQENSQAIIDLLTSNTMISSYLFAGLLILLYLLTIWRLKHIYKKEEDEDKEKRNLLNKYKAKQLITRNSYLVIAIIGLLFIWRTEIKDAVFSISFAVMAIVVLFKEILLNIISSFLISNYQFGDVIRIKGEEGTIVDRTLFNTKILLKKHGFNLSEEMIIPNSALIGGDVYLVSRFGSYGVHFFEIYVKNTAMILLHEKALRQAIDEILTNKNLTDNLRNWRKSLIKKESISVPDHAPFISKDLGKDSKLIVRITYNSVSFPKLREEIQTRYLELLPQFILTNEEQQEDA